MKRYFLIQQRLTRGWTQKPQQLSIFGEGSVKKVRDRLRSWRHLDRKIARLERLIESDKKCLSDLKDKIGISITPRYESMDMPSGTSDKVGNMAAKLIDSREEIWCSICANELEVHQLKRELMQIELAVAELSPSHAEIVRRFYLYEERWDVIAHKLHIQKSNFYKKLGEVLGLLGDLL